MSCMQPIHRSLRTLQYSTPIVLYIVKSARDTQKTPSRRQQRPSEVRPALRLHRSLHVQDILLELGLLEQFEQSTMRALHGSPGG
jgi:hypothetical protein